MPDRRFYHASSQPTQPTSRVDVRSRLRENVYVVYAGPSNVGANPVTQVYLNPLVNWIRPGAFLPVFGTLVALVPSKARRSAPRVPAAGLEGQPVGASGD